MIKSNITLLLYKPWTKSYYADYDIRLIWFKLCCGSTRRRNFTTASRYKACHRSVRPTCLMSHRYPYGPSTEYLEKSVRGKDRGRLTNARVVRISRDDKRNKSVQRDIRVLTAKQEYIYAILVTGTFPDFYPYSNPGPLDQLGLGKRPTVAQGTHCPASWIS